MYAGQLRAASGNVIANVADVGVRALNFEPDNRTYGLKGGWGYRAAQRYRRP